LYIFIATKTDKDMTISNKIEKEVYDYLDNVQSGLNRSVDFHRDGGYHLAERLAANYGGIMIYDSNRHNSTKSFASSTTWIFKDDSFLDIMYSYCAAVEYTDEQLAEFEA